MKFAVSIKSKPQLDIRIANFELSNNKINVLFGESGIGKTLISKALLGLLDDEEFTIRINDETYSQYLENLGVRDMISKSFYVFQEPSAHLSPVQTLGEQLNEGKIINSNEKRLVLENIFPDYSRERIADLLEVFPKPYRPSGGEKQRILNAMAFLAMNKLSFANAWNTLFVFDEPSGHLDVRLRNKLFDELIRMFIKDKPTVLFITHDYSLISYIESRYSPLSEFIRYSEIIKSGKELYQREFDPDEYLTWLNSVKQIEKLDKARETVLELKSGIKVFGKTLKFFADEKGEKEIPLILHKGEALYLKAPSGEGKTTVAKILLGLVKAEFQAKIEGARIDGKTKRKVFRKEIRGKKITMAFQHADEALNPKASVKEVFEALPVADFKRVEEMFEALFDEPMSNFSERKITTLSGGQKQKINILRTLVLDAPLTILDEPLSGADLHGAREIISFVREQIAKGKTFLIISHNEDIFDKIVSRKIYLKASD